jgi:hypothetical protein
MPLDDKTLATILTILSLMDESSNPERVRLHWEQSLKQIDLFRKGSGSPKYDGA